MTDTTQLPQTRCQDCGGLFDARMTCMQSLFEQGHWTCVVRCDSCADAASERAWAERIRRGRKAMKGAGDEDRNQAI